MIRSRPSAKKAIVLHQGSLGLRERCVCRILEFFGIPTEARTTSEAVNAAGKSGSKSGEYGIIGPLDAIADLLEMGQDGYMLLESAQAAYFYGAEDLSSCSEAFRSLFQIQSGSLEAPPNDIVRLNISSDFPDMTGPMTGLQVSVRLCHKDFIYTPGDRSSPFTSVISANEASVFLAGQLRGIPCFINTSSQMVDLDAPVTGGYYDVKSQFCAAVALVMFLKYVFAQVMWRPVEHGACVIIDDPLLKPRYGCCDFKKLLKLMEIYGFTTNIAFIPWNWRRTSKANAEFFRREPSHFSLSIHGCDHIAAEFGSSEPRNLAGKARLAQARMRRHEAKTRIRHEPIMVFPQGVFSIPCPELLKRTHFIAAVNTEVAPIVNSDISTKVRDVWDVAITKYGSFPIFTRRYPHHGLENFAFDLLLGKPCLIVTHHDSFKNEGQALIELVEKLYSLNAALQWRPLGEVIRRAGRYRITDKDMHEYWMYSQEFLIKNSGVDPAHYTVRKKEHDPDAISRVEDPQGELEWEVREGYIEFSGSVSGGEAKLLKVICKQNLEPAMHDRNLAFEFYVAARRLLCELRDEWMFQRDRLNLLRGRRSRLFES